MANALAIAGVTAVLKDLLNDGLLNANVSDAFDFAVTARPPERLAREEENATATQPRLNLYLYRVTPNTGWVNERLPSRSRSGRRTQNPYLALDLHYLLSAYGLEDLQAEVLLGYGMQLLHEMPVLDRQRIRDSLTPDHPDASLLPAPFSSLDAEMLAEQIEQIRIAPFHHDSEEMSRLWSSLHSGLRPSARYVASVVLIESQRSVATGPPVRTRQLYARQLQRPRITQLRATSDPVSVPPTPGQVITHAHRLTLDGSGLRGEITRVQIGDQTLAEPALVALTDRRVDLDVPASLRPGLVAVQITHALDKTAPAVGQLPMETSNTVAFLLAPSFAAAPSLETPLPGDPTAPVTGTVRLAFAHGAGRDQTVTLLLDEMSTAPAADRAAYAYSFPAAPAASEPPDDPAPDLWDVAITGVERALYLVRVRVDGAVSAVGAPDGPVHPDVQALADAGIYADPILHLGTP
ncbi:MAG: DUF4255 domain-containing protein [Acidobacteriota bacterium]